MTKRAYILVNKIVHIICVHITSGKLNENRRKRKKVSKRTKDSIKLTFKAFSKDLLTSRRVVHFGRQIE